MSVGKGVSLDFLFFAVYSWPAFLSDVSFLFYGFMDMFLLSGVDKLQAWWSQNDVSRLGDMDEDDWQLGGEDELGKVIQIGID